MSWESSWNQNQVPLPPLCNPSPAVFDWADESMPLARKGFNMIQQELHSQNHQVLKSGCNTMQSLLPITRHSLGRETGTIRGLYPLSNQLFVNVPNIAQNSNLAHNQVTLNETNANKAFPPSTDWMLVNKSNVNTYLQNNQFSSEVRMIQGFHPATDQLSANVSSISQQSCSLSHQLPTSGIDINQNSNAFNQQMPINVPQIKYLPIHVLSQSEFRRNQVKYTPDHQQLEREIVMSQGLRSIFGCYSKERLGILQNPYIASQQNVLNRVSHPVSVNSPETRFNRSQELLDQNLYPQYLEKVQICVVGPPRCGKADLIRTFARNDDIRISTDKPLNWVFQQGMASFGTTLKIDIWYGDLSSSAEDIKSLCQSSKSVIVLVYNVSQKSSLLTVLEWIEYLKRDIDFKVPIILIGNVSNIVSSCASKEFPKITPNIVPFMDGVRARDEYGFAAFYECSTKCVKDVEAIFLVAALKAFHRTL